jgi:hypothetical protein
MIDTPNNCYVQATASRAHAAEASLANVRLRHIAAAEAWESLAKILQGNLVTAATARIEAFTAARNASSARVPAAGRG